MPICLLIRAGHELTQCIANKPEKNMFSFKLVKPAATDQVNKVGRQLGDRTFPHFFNTVREKIFRTYT